MESFFDDYDFYVRKGAYSSRIIMNWILGVKCCIPDITAGMIRAKVKLELSSDNSPITVYIWSILNMVSQTTCTNIKWCKCRKYPSIYCLKNIPLRIPEDVKKPHISSPTCKSNSIITNIQSHSFHRCLTAPDWEESGTDVIN